MWMYERYKQDMLGVALSLTGRRPLAEDVVQDVFAYLARRGRHLRIRRNLKAYLLAAVCNRVRTLARQPTWVALDGDPPPRDNETDPSDDLAASEQAATLRGLLGTLPSEQQDVVVLHLQQDLSFREIGTHLGISANTAKSRFRYALSKLRQKLSETEL